MRYEYENLGFVFVWLICPSHFMEDLIAIRLLSLIVIIIKMTFCSINFELDRRRHTKNKYCYGLCNLQRLSHLNVSFFFI